MRLVIGLSVLLASAGAQAQTCNVNIERSTPDSRYELLNNGSEVKDQTTGLVWQRCSLGQIWSGTTCTGTPSLHEWPDALAKAKAVGVGYRLPNIKELQTLVDSACYAPAINTTLFPSTPDHYYWSSSLFMRARVSVWRVDFYNGSSQIFGKQASQYVRAVRSGL